MKKLVLYNHGKESEPWGAKPLAFADVAKRHGYSIESPDYREEMDPDERVKKLLAMDLSGYDEVVLMGSSMGAYVATVAAQTIKPKGLLLLAPAFYLPDYQEPNLTLRLIEREYFTVGRMMLCRRIMRGDSANAIVSV